MNSVILELLNKEQERQNNFVELIASENFVSENVLKALGSCLTNKYAEGYPENRTTGNCGRYYGGCEYVDQIEETACDIWKKAFDTDYHCNVQPHSGTQANVAVYQAVLNVGDTILSMSLDNGGHLSHGSSVHIAGKLYNIVFYSVDENGYIDLDDMKKKAEQYRPKIIIAGASAYPRIIPFDKIAEIAHSVGAYFMTDIAHIAGLVVAKEHPTPFGIADFVTTTTHKTLRGPRGGMIFCKKEFAKKIDSAIFPCTQGGPLLPNVAAKGVAGEEALTDEYKDYIRQVVKNSKAMCKKFIDMGYTAVTGGTDNHLFLLDLRNKGVTGLDCQKTLDANHITLNKNCIPNDPQSPKITSGVRIGTAAMTTKGWKEKDFENMAVNIDKIISSIKK